MNRKKKPIRQVTAIYCRLSLEDGRDNESMSISNQKLLLSDYAEKNGLTPYEYYVDDGYTGRNFNRPGFQRMLSDIEAGTVGTVLTKDLSRLGRNYIEAGSYIEIYFPKHNIRYIAVNDGYDSANRQNDQVMDITPFKNILNDMYSRDISRKVSDGKMVLSRQGKFVGGQPPLGLMQDPDNQGHLIIDPETAPIIRHIYDLALEGNGCMKIRKTLMEERIPITRLRPTTLTDAGYYFWGDSRISNILRNPIYKGGHVVCRTHQKGIRSNTYNIIPRDQWEIVENAHEAIITREEWDRVQEIIDRRPPIMQGEPSPFYNLFHGLLYCADCGKSMQARYEKVGRKDVNRTTKAKREPIDKAYYICQTYNRLGCKVCPSHKIEARDLYNLVLADIQALAAQAIRDEETFYQRLVKKLANKYHTDAASLHKEMNRLLYRNQEIDDTFLSLYTDKSKGILTEQRFLKLTMAMENEQKENNARISEIQAILRDSIDQESDIRQFITEICQYAEITELDEGILNHLIDRIMIGDVKKVNGEKVQEVRIFYNFVGEVGKMAA